jgi:hypothetical protein
VQILLRGVAATHDHDVLADVRPGEACGRRLKYVDAPTTEPAVMSVVKLMTDPP